MSKVPELKLNQVLIDRGERLKFLRKLTRFTRKGFAAKYQIPLGSLQNWEDARYGGISEKSASKLLEAFRSEGINCTLEWLLYGTGVQPSNLLLQNYRPHIERALSEAEIIAQELKLFYENNKNAVDAVVLDDSMYPYFLPGDHVAGRKCFSHDIELLVGLNCIVQTNRGETYIRNLQKGNHSNHYNLLCTNPSFSLTNMENIELLSAAPIIWIRRHHLIKN